MRILKNVAKRMFALLLAMALVFPMLPELTVSTLRIPADGAYQSTYVREMAVLLPNLAKNRALLEDVMKVSEAE